MSSQELIQELESDRKVSVDQFVHLPMAASAHLNENSNQELDRQYQSASTLPVISQPLMQPNPNEWHLYKSDSKTSFSRYTSKSSHYAQRMIHGQKDYRLTNPQLGGQNRYTPYSPRTRKAMEAIGDIKHILERRRENRKKFQEDMLLMGDNMSQRLLSPQLNSPSTDDKYRYNSPSHAYGSN